MSDPRRDSAAPGHRDPSAASRRTTSADPVPPVERYLPVNPAHGGVGHGRRAVVPAACGGAGVDPARAAGGRV